MILTSEMRFHWLPSLWKAFCLTCKAFKGAGTPAIFQISRFTTYNNDKITKYLRWMYGNMKLRTTHALWRAVDAGRKGPIVQGFDLDLHPEDFHYQLSADPVLDAVKREKMPPTMLPLRGIPDAFLLPVPDACNRVLASLHHLILHIAQAPHLHEDINHILQQALHANPSTNVSRDKFNLQIPDPKSEYYDGYFSKLDFHRAYFVKLLHLSLTKIYICHD
ncbi:hypothetical protein P154DRAFT_567616 [Amniculicola lignicola CBS 123094]|uniref:Uncharacterized protein n=1 Tax=Amniculicola lignicola CBS 123094 TaxID=1392246 RepID=A0A6A5VYC6_9PLEO|nr:hypothetical protein P154DRAFT_567616 [Amniculicola lignicola CBS 123094]